MAVNTSLLIVGCRYHNDKTVYVEGIPYTASEEDVQSFFASCGTVISLRMPRYQDSGRPRGYAHVEFASKAQAAAAIKLSGECAFLSYVIVHQRDMCCLSSWLFFPVLCDTK